MTKYNDTFNQLLLDEDFHADVRGILIDGNYDGMHDYESGRQLDLSTAWGAFCSMSTGERTEIYMEFSLCPIHHIDWAICFDDQPDNCDQVRAIYPDRHDT